METTLICLIVRYKRGEKDAFLGICEKMSPLIIKYARILKFCELDDMKSELVLALLECVERIEIYSNEQEVLRYVKQAVQFKFHELYRSSKKQMNEVNLDSEDTGANLEPKHLPICINGEAMGDFGSFYSYVEGDIFIEFIFTEEDSKAFYEDIMK